MKEAKSKIQLRAEILKKLNQVKFELENNSLDKHKLFQEFAEINDYKTLTNTIIGEMSSNKTMYDYILSSILVNGLGKNSEQYLFDAIMSDKYSNSKRVYLVNVLSEINKDADYMALLNSILGADDINELEDDTIKDLPISPLRQIDFLDFYMQCKPQEKELFLKSILDETIEEDKVHVYSLLIYLNDEYTLKAIDEIVKTRSKFAYYPLNFASEFFNNKKIKASAKTAINKLKLMNIPHDIPRHIAYKDMLYDT